MRIKVKLSGFKVKFGGIKSQTCVGLFSLEDFPREFGFGSWERREKRAREHERNNRE